MEGVADKWMSVGLLLGISYKILQICELSDTLDEKVNGVVEAWLGKKYDVESFGEASWRKLVEVVASRAGGCHQALAAKIARQHPIVNGTSLYSVYSPSLYNFERISVDFSCTCTNWISFQRSSLIQLEQLLAEWNLYVYVWTDHLSFLQV